jgi:hypothetical protein
MARNAAVREFTPVQSITVGPDVHVTITLKIVDGVVGYDVSQSYIRVPRETMQSIIWTIDRSLLPFDIKVAFDNPAITLFGGEFFQRTGELTAQIDWTNMPSQEGRSFYYTLRMFGAKIDATTGELKDFFAISHDPTIHNEPPS